MAEPRLAEAVEVSASSSERRGSAVNSSGNEARELGLLTWSRSRKFYERSKLWWVSRTRKVWFKLLTKKGKPTFRYKYLLRNLPLVNFFYDLFFDGSVVHPDSVKSLMDVLGLINALLLGAIASLFGSVDYDEMIAADTIFAKDADTGYSTYWWKWYSQLPSQYVYIKIGNTLIYLFIGIISIIYVYADSISKTPGGEEEDEEDAPVKVVMLQEQTDGKLMFSKNHWSEEEVRSKITLDGNPEIVVDAKSATRKMTNAQKEMESYQLWWGYSKFTLILTFFTTLAAVVNAILGVLVFFSIKYPDYYMLEYGAHDESNADSMTGTMVRTFKTWFIGVGACVVILSGLGTAAKYEREDDFKELEDFQDRLESYGIDVNYTEEKITNMVKGHTKRYHVVQVLANMTRFLVSAQIDWELAAKLVNVVIATSHSGKEHPIISKERLNWHISMALHELNNTRNDLESIHMEKVDGHSHGKDKKKKGSCCVGSSVGPDGPSDSDSDSSTDEDDEREVAKEDVNSSGQ